MASYFLSLLLGAASAQADVAPTEQMAAAENRLGACLMSGATSVRHPDVRSAVLAVRARCGRDIRRVQRDRVAVATRGLSGIARDRAEHEALTALNNEIAQVIANHAGFGGQDLQRR